MTSQTTSTLYTSWRTEKSIRIATVSADRASLRWRLNSWLQGEGTFGLRSGGAVVHRLVPFGYLTSSGTTTKGSLFQSAINDWQSNAGVTLTSLRHFGSSITNTTKIAAIFENQRNRLLASFAGAFVVPRVPEFTGGLIPRRCPPPLR